MKLDYEISTKFQEIEREQPYNTNCDSVQFLKSLTLDEAVALYFKGLQNPKGHHTETGITMENFYNYYYYQINNKKLMLKEQPKALDAVELCILFDKIKNLNLVIDKFDVEGCIDKFLTWAIYYDAYYFRYLIEKFNINITYEMYEMSIRRGNKIMLYLEPIKNSLMK
jgi:hypothetical protein